MAAVRRSKNWANWKGPQGDRVRICTYKGKMVLQLKFISGDLDLDLVTGPSSGGGAPAWLMSVADDCGMLLLDGDEA